VDKKKQKNFIHLRRACLLRVAQANEDFLVLFCKKEHTSLLP